MQSLFRCKASLTLVLLNKLDATSTSNFQPMRLLDSGFWYKFTYLMTNSADPDQLAKENICIKFQTLFFSRYASDLDFYSPVNPVKVMLSRSVNLNLQFYWVVLVLCWLTSTFVNILLPVNDNGPFLKY